jgi:hypothetical protein
MDPCFFSEHILRKGTSPQMSKNFTRLTINKFPLQRTMTNMRTMGGLHGENPYSFIQFPKKKSVRLRQNRRMMKRISRRNSQQDSFRKKTLQKQGYVSTIRYKPKFRELLPPQKEAINDKIKELT